MQLLCQKRAPNFIWQTALFCPQKTGSDTPETTKNRVCRIRKQCKHDIGATPHMHQYRALLISHQFGAELRIQLPQARQQTLIGRRNHIRMAFDTQLNVTSVLGVVHARQTENLD